MKTKSNKTKLLIGVLSLIVLICATFSIINLNNNNVAYAEGSISLTHVSASRQDKNSSQSHAELKRYNVSMSTGDIDCASDYSAELSFEVTKNGESIGMKQFNVNRKWAESNMLMLLFTYDTLTGATPETAEEITDEYLVTLKAGTDINGYTLDKDVTYYIKGTSISLRKGNITLEHLDAGSQDNPDLKRYLITMSTGEIDVTSTYYGNIDFIVYKNGVNLGTKAFGIDRVWSGPNKLYFFIYYDVLADVEKAEEVIDNYILKLPKGTIIDGYSLANDVVYTINGASIRNADPEILVEHNITIDEYDTEVATITVKDNITSALVNDEITLEIDIIDGYEVSSIEINGQEQTLGGRLKLVENETNKYTFSFSMLMEDVVVSVEFSRIKATVTKNTTGVTIDVITAEQELFTMDTYSFKVMVDAGFVNNDMKVFCNDNELTANNEGVYTITLEKTNILTVTGIDFIKYTVTFMNGTEKYKEVTVNYNGTVSEPTAPTKDGYTFDGWYNGEEKYDFYNVVDKDLTLNAKFIETPIDENNQKGDTKTEEAGCNSSISSNVIPVLCLMAIFSMVIFIKKQKRN